MSLTGEPLLWGLGLVPTQVLMPISRTSLRSCSAARSVFPLCACLGFPFFESLCVQSCVMDVARRGGRWSAGAEADENLLREKIIGDSR